MLRATKSAYSGARLLDGGIAFRNPIGLATVEMMSGFLRHKGWGVRGLMIKRAGGLVILWDDSPHWRLEITIRWPASPKICVPHTGCARQPCTSTRGLAQSSSPTVEHVTLPVGIRITATELSYAYQHDMDALKATHTPNTAYMYPIDAEPEIAFAVGMATDVPHLSVVSSHRDRAGTLDENHQVPVSFTF